MNKILNKVREIITNKFESNNKRRNANKKDANKVKLNKWGFPVFPNKFK